MAVIVKYVVVRNGREDMTFSTKKEAESYDKMLDIAERLSAFLQTAATDLSEDQLDDLTFFMAQHRNAIGKLLQGSKLEPPAADAESAQLPQVEADELPLSENHESKASKRSRATKPKAAA